MADKPEMTIIVPNYKTPELTKICLRSLRKYTDCSRVKVVVIDNDSNDESLEYLRSLKWITLMERKTGNEGCAAMHAKALDMVMETVDTPLVLVMHTDTIIIHENWLDFLLKKIYASPDIAGVGSWKLETVPPVKAFFKRIETWIRRVILKKKILDRKHYFRSHCALYKSSAVRETKGFFDNESACLSMFRFRLMSQTVCQPVCSPLRVGQPSVVRQSQPRMGHRLRLVQECMYWKCRRRRMRFLRRKSPVY